MAQEDEAGGLEIQNQPASQRRLHGETLSQGKKQKQVTATKPADPWQHCALFEDAFLIRFYAELKHYCLKAFIYFLLVELSIQFSHNAKLKWAKEQSLNFFTCEIEELDQNSCSLAGVVELQLTTICFCYNKFELFVHRQSLDGLLHCGFHIPQCPSSPLASCILPWRPLNFRSLGLLSPICFSLTPCLILQFGSSPVLGKLLDLLESILQMQQLLVFV